MIVVFIRFSWDPKKEVVQVAKIKKKAVRREREKIKLKRESEQRLRSFMLESATCIKTQF